jgi:glucose/arabinose dehydrogenase
MRHAVLSLITAVTLPAAILAQGRQSRVIVPIRSVTNKPARDSMTDHAVSRLHAATGYQVTIFAKGLGGPRMLALDDDGTLYVTRRDSGDVLAFATTDVRSTTHEARTVVKDLPRVHGIAIHEGQIFLATVKEIMVGDLGGGGGDIQLDTLVDDLPDGGQHPNRTLAFGPDGWLYVSIGSTCNQCIETTNEHATIIRMRPDGSERGVFARGLRNTVGFDWNPRTHELWGLDHGADGKGNAIPPEELNKLQIAAFYGWPFCYGEKTVDKSYPNEPDGSTKEEVCKRSVAPVLTLPAHSAPLQFVFANDSEAFAALHGSWNRQPASGYKVVRIKFDNGQPVAVEDFLSGFLSQAGTSYIGRPAGIAVAKDGTVFVSDDANGVIYRVSHSREGGAQ